MKRIRTLSLVALSFVLISGFGGIGCQKKGPKTSGDGGSGVTLYDLGLEKIYFEFDKYDVQPRYQQTLQNHADWLKNNPDVNVVIEGNTDERGTEEYNLALGERRAMAAKSYLQNLGISPDRLSTVSYGESRPADPSSNEGAWSQNRRDEFKGRK